MDTLQKEKKVMEYIRNRKVDLRDIFNVNSYEEYKEKTSSKDPLNSEEWTLIKEWSIL